MQRHASCTTSKEKSSHLLYSAGQEGLYPAQGITAYSVVVLYAVNVGGELFQKPWRSRAELHLPGPPGTEMSCTVTALGLVSFRIWWRSMLYRSAVDDVLQGGLAGGWRERDWSVVCRLVTVCLLFFTEDGNHPRFFQITEMAQRSLED